MVDGSAMRVSGYAPDVNSPTLLSFTVLNPSYLKLVFNEPMSVIPDTIFVTDVEFMNMLPSMGSRLAFSLENAVLVGCESAKCTQILFTLGGESSTDFRRIKEKAQGTIFERQEDTYLRINAGMMSDTSGNKVNGIVAQDALALGPSVSDFDLDMDTGELILYFSEDVNSTFTLENVVIQPMQVDDDSCASRTVYDSVIPCVILTSTTPAIAYGDSTDTYLMTLSADDLNSLKVCVCV